MTTRMMSLKRLAATVGVFALAVSGAAVGVGAASAALPDGNPPPAQAGSGATGTLTVHKYAGSDTEQPNNGTQITVARPPVGGVTFEISRVGQGTQGSCSGIDLTTSAGWALAETVIDEGMPLPSGFCLIPAGSGLTAAGTGIVSFEGLDLGLYFVEETDAPPGITPSVDFFVTVPFASVAGVGTSATTTWLYDVHVYPKNDLEGETDKTVSDPDALGLGSTVTWSMTTTPIGVLNDGESVTAYSVIDNLDSKLTYKAATAKLQYQTPGGTLTEVPAGNFAWTMPAEGTAGGTLAAVFNDGTDETADGLAWLNGQPAGTYLVMSFDTVVTGVGSINNEGFENIGGDNMLLGSASTQWGPAQLTKHQVGDITKTLKGAKFEVYASDAEGVCPAVGDLGTAISINGVSEFGSDDDGIVTIEGLYVGYDNETPSETYCVVETAPPAGYLADLSTVHPIVVKAELTPSTTAMINVPNTPIPGPELPLTGSSGTLMLTVLGLGLVGLGAGGVAVRRNRASKQH